MHPEVLTKPAADLFESLGNFLGFYLAGGTALALQLGHRISIDFDLFSDTEIDRAMLQRVRREFPGATISPLVNNADELTVLVNEVKITFLQYPFPPRNSFVMYTNVPLLSVREIAATKAYTIGRRGSYKDYVDLYFIVSEHHAALSEIIERAEKAFGGDFDSRLFLEQLVFLDDIEAPKFNFSSSLSRPLNWLHSSNRTFVRACASSNPSMHRSAGQRFSQHQRTMRDLARCDHGEQAPESIRELRTLTEERLENRLQRANSVLSLDRVKALVFEAGAPEFRTYLAALLTALNPDRASDERALSHRLNLLSREPKIVEDADDGTLQLIQDVWRCLPSSLS